MSTRQLTTGSIPAHVRSIALPSSIGLFFQTMYNVVDSFYAGQLSTTALAALGLSFPVFLLIIATSGGLSRGASALIANAIGEGDEVSKHRFVRQSLSLGILLSLGLAVVGFLAAPALFGLLGATGEYLTLALRYMNPIFAGSVFFIVSSVSNAILVASGDSKTFSKVLVIGFFLNLILDPWLLYGGYGLPAMGIAGIAWATVIIQMFSSAFMLMTVLRRGLLNLQPMNALLPHLASYREIGRQAIPASFSILSVAVGFFVITYFLKGYGKPTVAAFGVTTRIEQIGLLPTFGLYSAIMALVGQNNGAKIFSRVRESMRVCNIAGLLLVVTTSSLIFLFATQLMRVFTDDPEVIEIGVRYVHIMALIQWSYVMTSTHLAFLQAMKRPRYGFFESILRKVLLPVPFMWLFVKQYHYSVDAVWFSVAGANVFMTVITVAYGQSQLMKLKQIADPLEPVGTAFE